MYVLVPQGIGDSVWALFKIQDLVKQHGGRDQRIDVKVACWKKNALECRALPFLERFKFINSVEIYPIAHNGNAGPVLLPGPAADENGVYRYIPDGPPVGLPDIDYALIPNAALERGIRLENWLPELKINWNIMNEFRFTDDEITVAKDRLWLPKHRRGEFSKYVGFYMSAVSGNSIAGHNRHGYWTPEDWVTLGEEMHRLYGVHILLIGTAYDEDYYYQLLRPLTIDKPHWHNCLSRWSAPQVYAILNESRLVISYQSGIGIVSHYLGVPTAIWWRPNGDSISPNFYLSFDEGMASAWNRPDYLAEGRILPAIYKKHGVQEVMSWVKQHGWLE